MIRHAVPDAPGFWSSGIRDLDELLGGGYRPGSVFAIEGDETVAPGEFFDLTLPTLLNFLEHRRGAIVVPPAGVPARAVRDRALRYVPGRTFDAKVRVFDYTSVESGLRWLVPMARLGRVEAMRAVVRAEKEVSGNPRAPYVECSAVDTLETVTNAEVAGRMLLNGILRAKEVGNLGFVWMRSGSANREAVRGMADGYLVLTRDERGVTVQGIRPAWAARPITWMEANGEARVALGLPR